MIPIAARIPSVNAFAVERPRAEFAPFADVGAWAAAMRGAANEIGALAVVDPAAARELARLVSSAVTIHGSLVCMDVEPFAVLLSARGLGPRMPNFRRLIEARRWQVRNPGRPIIARTDV